MLIEEIPTVETIEESPVETTELGAQEGNAGPVGETPDIDPEKTPNEPTEPAQSPEEDSKYAAARRRAEAEWSQRLEAEKARFQAEKDALAAQTWQMAYGNQPSPYIGRVPKTAQEVAMHNEAAQRERLSQAGIDPGVLNQYIEQLPAVRQAKEFEERQRQEQVSRHVDNNLKELQRAHPEIKGFEDVETLPAYPQIIEKVKRGYSLLDAYELANKDSIIAQRAAAAKQKALNDAAGKGHLTATGGTGGKGVVVPADVVRTYKRLDPSITDKQIQEHYSKFHKGE